MSISKLIWVHNENNNVKNKYIVTFFIVDKWSKKQLLGSKKSIYW